MSQEGAGVPTAVFRRHDVKSVFGFSVKVAADLSC